MLKAAEYFKVVEKIYYQMCPFIFCLPEKLDEIKPSGITCQIIAVISLREFMWNCFHSMNS